MTSLVTVEMLQALAANGPQSQEPQPQSTGGYSSNIDLERVLIDGGIEYTRKQRSYGVAFDLKQCLTSDAHDTGASFVQMESGALVYRCLHDTCRGKSWYDVKSMLKLPPKPTLTVNGKEAGNTRNQSERAEPVAAVLKLRRASEIEPRDIDWLWPRWLPFGMLTLFAGYGGSGKSTSALAIAAACTVEGALPDGTQAPLTNVLILAAEDSPEHTLVPRLDSLGADLERVHIVDGVVRDNDEPAWVQLAEHMPLIEATVQAEGIGLVILDPISSYIGSANSDKEGDVRSSLMPVVRMAERTGAAVLAIRHVSKGGDNSRAASKILGSTAWVDVARSVWMLADAPEEHQPEKNEDGTRSVKRVLGVVKSNIAAKPAARWGIQPADGPFRWLSDPSPVTVDECFRAAADGGSRAQDAEAWLRERLAGGMQRSSDVEDAAKQAGISKRTLERARAALNVKKRKDNGGWWIMLPPQITAEENQDRQEFKTANSLKGGGLGGLDLESKTANVADLAAFRQPRGKTYDNMPDAPGIQDRQENQDRQHRHLRELGGLPDSPSDPETEWSMDL